MMPNDVIWPSILNFTFFLKSQEIVEIDTKSSRSTYEMQKFGEFLELNEENWKNAALGPIKLIFGQTHMKLAVAMVTPRMMDT